MKKKHKRPWGVFIAIFLAILFGTWVGPTGSLGGIPFYSIFEVLGTLFLHALQMVVVPLVTSSIICGISRVGSDAEFGRIGGKTFSFYIGTSLLAIVIGLFFVNVIGPGIHYEWASQHPSAQNIEQIQSNLYNNEAKAFTHVILQIVPANIFDALSRGQMLSLIFFSLLFGYVISKIDTAPASVLQRFFQGIFQAMIRITQIIMKCLPYGVFCLIAKVFMTTGIGSLTSVALFALTVLLGLGTFMFIGLPLLLKFIGRVKPSRHLKAMTPALITAFSTSSSSATLPVTIDCVEKRVGVSNRICSLVVPLGTSINMSGSALYECVAAIFIAQAYGIEISLSMQFIVIVLSLITSIGVAGIPSASLVAILVILNAIGLPAEGVGLVLAVDRLLDMCRTTVNVYSDSCCAVLVARSEGEKTVLTKDPDLMANDYT